MSRGVDAANEVLQRLQDSMAGLFEQENITIYDGVKKSYLQLRSNIIADQIIFSNIVAPATIQLIGGLAVMADSYSKIRTIKSFIEFVPDQQSRISKFETSYAVIKQLNKICQEKQVARDESRVKIQYEQSQQELYQTNGKYDDVITSKLRILKNVLQTTY